MNALAREVHANDDSGKWEVLQGGAVLAEFDSESWAHEFAAAPDLLATCRAA